MSRAFIIYPRNPEPYLWTPPTEAEVLRRRFPEKSEDEILLMRTEEAKAIELKKKRLIHNHENLVHRFAEFLTQNGVEVVHQGQIADQGLPNLMRWYQDELKLCNFIILIITKSFSHFLSNPHSFPHNGEEAIFEGQFLYNLIHLPNKPLLPVFLGGEKKDLSLLPDSLRMSSTYHIKTEFSLNHSETSALYAFLTNQNPCAPLPAGPVVAISGPRRFGPRSKVQQQQLSSGPNCAKYLSLKECTRMLSSPVALRVAETEIFSKRWKKLAEHLSISAAKVEDIEGSDPDESERCYNMLREWMRRENNDATVSRLAEAIWKCQDLALLDKAHEIL